MLGMARKSFTKPYKDLDRRKSAQHHALVKHMQALKSVTAPSLADFVTSVKLFKILASVFFYLKNGNGTTSSEPL